MAHSWTSLTPPRSASSAVLAAGLLLLALSAASGATAAVVRGTREEASPLALLVIRAVGGGLGDGAPPSPVAVAQLDGVMDVPSAGALRRAPPIQAADGDIGDTVFLRAAKRQVRYHQCYFNPISCFG